MKTVTMFAESSGETKEFSPEHAQNILNYQMDNHLPEKKCWTVADQSWDCPSGKLTLRKKSNGDQSDTGIGSKAPQRKRNSEGSDPQP
jgi:hypothetical protein